VRIKEGETRTSYLKRVVWCDRDGIRERSRPRETGGERERERERERRIKSIDKVRRAICVVCTTQCCMHYSYDNIIVTQFLNFIKEL